jgi:hypothetical protein
MEAAMRRSTSTLRAIVVLAGAAAVLTACAADRFIRVRLRLPGLRRPPVGYPVYGYFDYDYWGGSGTGTGTTTTGMTAATIDAPPGGRRA